MAFISIAEKTEEAFSKGTLLKNEGVNRGR